MKAFTQAQTRTSSSLRLPAAFDALSVEQLRNDFEQLAQAGTDVEIEFNDVEFIDSSGIGILVFLFKRLRAEGFNLKLRNVQGQPLQLFQHLHIDRTIEVEAA